MQNDKPSAVQRGQAHADARQHEAERAEGARRAVALNLLLAINHRTDRYMA